jgi:hypothetical protein
VSARDLLHQVQALPAEEQRLFMEELRDLRLGGEPSLPRKDERDRLFQVLASQAEDCANEGWDGHGAMPVTLETYRAAYRFAESLPASAPSPSVGAEPDGHLTLEWYRNPSRVLSLSIGPEGELSYAALLGETSRRTGSERFEQEVPRDLLHLIDEVFAA